MTSESSAAYCGDILHILEEVFSLRISSPTDCLLHPKYDFDCISLLYLITLLEAKHGVRFCLAGPDDSIFTVEGLGRFIARQKEGAASAS